MFDQFICWRETSWSIMRKILISQSPRPRTLRCNVLGRHFYCLILCFLCDQPTKIGFQLASATEWDLFSCDKRKIKSLGKNYITTSSMRFTWEKVRANFSRCRPRREARNADLSWLAFGTTANFRTGHRNIRAAVRVTRLPRERSKMRGLHAARDWEGVLQGSWILEKRFYSRSD